ncbi:MAG: glycosyltransferase [Chloroflexi bacterium]|nr:glycosyltransferase [Chloroflexota bacterium]
MRILLLTPQLPYPPLQGTTLRNYYILRELSRRHRVSLLSFIQAGDELTPDSPLHGLCETIRTVPAPPPRPLSVRARDSLLAPQPDMALRLASDAMLAAAREMVAGGFDVIQAEGIEMAGYTMQLKSDGVRARTVFDDHNAEYVLQRSAYEADRWRPARWHAALYSLVQWAKLAAYERRVLLAHDAAAAVSDVDAAALRQIASAREIVVVPNGVDTDEYAPGVEPAVPPRADGVEAPTRELPFDTLRARPGESLVFTGKMDYRPNVDAALWFADEIMPLVRAQAPAARFVIVGQQPHARLAALTGRADVTLTGRVDDVKPYIAQAAVYVAPLRMGGGTRFKVLQAMAMAAPIVATTFGASGIGAQDGRELLIADTPRDFAAAVLRLLGDADLRRQIGAHARQLAVERYDWRTIGPLLEQLYVS